MRAKRPSSRTATAAMRGQRSLRRPTPRQQAAPPISVLASRARMHRCATVRISHCDRFGSLTSQARGSAASTVQTKQDFTLSIDMGSSRPRRGEKPPAPLPPGPADSGRWHASWIMPCRTAGSFGPEFLELPALERVPASGGPESLSRFGDKSLSRFEPDVRFSSSQQNRGVDLGRDNRRSLARSLV
jgi:hypothetical protein